MSKILLITGATGFLGSHMLSYCQAILNDIELFATDIKPVAANLSKHRYYQINLNNAKDVQEMIDSCKPDYVIHFASLIAEKSLANLFQVNVLGTENLYEALGKYRKSKNVRVIQISTAAVYGVVSQDDLPVTEKHIPRPISGYAISKLAQEHLAWMNCQKYDLPVIIARIFNIVGLDQSPNLVPMTFITQLQNVKKKLSDHIKIGNATTRRDFVDVRDVMTALIALLEYGISGEIYNIASGNDVSINEVLEMLQEIGEIHVPIRQNSDRIKSTDIPCIRADISKIKMITNWKPRYELCESLEYVWQNVNLHETK